MGCDEMAIGYENANKFIIRKMQVVGKSNVSECREGNLLAVMFAKKLNAIMCAIIQVSYSSENADEMSPLLVCMHARQFFQMGVKEVEKLFLIFCLL